MAEVNTSTCSSMVTPDTCQRMNDLSGVLCPSQRAGDANIRPAQPRAHRAYRQSAYRGEVPLRRDRKQSRCLKTTPEIQTDGGVTYRQKSSAFTCLYRLHNAC